MSAIPERLQKRPQDHRGFVVPFVTSMRDGKPDFRSIDTEKVLDVARRELCALCGEPLDYWIAFIGGPLSARNRAYSDSGMHLDCAEYAVAVCPYLVYRDKPRSTAAEDTRPSPGHIDTKPECTTLALTRGYEVLLFADGRFLFHTEKPKWVRNIPFKERVHA